MEEFCPEFRSGIGKGLSLCGAPRGRAPAASLCSRKARDGRESAPGSGQLPAPSLGPPAAVLGWRREGIVSTGETECWKWSFKGDAELKVRQYNPIYPFTFKASFFKLPSPFQILSGRSHLGALDPIFKSLSMPDRKLSPNSTPPPTSALKQARVFVCVFKII